MLLYRVLINPGLASQIHDISRALLYSSYLNIMVYVRENGQTKPKDGRLGDHSN